MDKHTNLGSLDQDIQSSIQHLEKLKGRANLLNHTLDVPFVFCFFSLLILFHLNAEYGISSPKYIFTLLIGVSTTYISLRSIIPVVYLEICDDLKVIKREQDKENYLADLIDKSSMWETDKNYFSDGIIFLHQKYSSKIRYATVLSLFPSVVGIMEYLYSL